MQNAKLKHACCIVVKRKKQYKYTKEDEDIYIAVV